MRFIGCRTIGLLAASYCLVGCEASLPGCSDSNAQDLVKQIDMDYLKDLIRDNKVIDVSKTKINLSNIITEASDEHSKSCSAQIQADYYYFEDAAKKEGSASYKGPLQKITYILKKTDDGRLNAEVQGLN